MPTEGMVPRKRRNAGRSKRAVQGRLEGMVDRREPVDVVVVGAGFGGAAFAWRLSQQRPGLKIVVLDRGGPADYAAMPMQTAGWQRAFLGPWAPSPNMRLAAGAVSPSADYPIDDSNSAFKPLMWNGFGGSTVNWAAHFPRLHPSDFRTRSLDGVGDDWPFSYADLEPYYDLNDERMGVAGLAGDPAYPPKPERAMPPVAPGRMGNLAAKAFDKLGWHWWPVDAAINTRPHAGRPACNHCGPCLTGCTTLAKASVDQTYLADAVRSGVELRGHAVVFQVEMAAGRATGVRYRDGAGTEVAQPAAAVVVAGNGIGTARLLLASGLSSPALGHNLMFHGGAYVRGLFREELDGPVGPGGCAIYSHQFYETDLSRGFTRGVHLQVTRENPLMTQASRLPTPWGAESQALVRDEFKRSMAVLVLNEDLPEAHNRVTLTDRIEADGLPGVKLDYTVSAHTRKALDFGLDRAEEILQAAGAVATVRVDLAPYTGWHLLGTARMGVDPATSVTDGSGRCHAVANLIMADGSLFPTVGAVNPGSTIGALALRIADDLARDMA
ncbi:GMC family oxidoreductase [Phreatobacter stygius]|uniref:GMC family oxidoreductase n=2 Tax=Phreatobacter stygius TaxID=1940610 RepID=A0A4D7AQL3_9HYPH|nr:GMC family oxidoreductase [Phreatobacter stygius]